MAVDSESIAKQVVLALEHLNVPYMLTGALAVNLYSQPRSTKDADFVVQWRSHSIDDLLGLLHDHFYLDHQMGFETVTATTRWHLRIKNTAFTVELFDLTDDAHNQARFARRVRRPFVDIEAWFPTAEDALIQKVRWASTARRSKDADDAVRMVAVSGSLLDWDYITAWCDQHRTGELLVALRSRADEL